MGGKQIAFFLGSSSPGGFYSFFQELYAPEEGWYAYILKGGPGTGKSALLSYIADTLEERGLYTERIHCAADPQSLDAVRFPELRVCVADGTSPHTIEPRFPGAAEELVNLGAFWDGTLLRENSAAIISLTQKNVAGHRRCQRFLSAAASLKADVCRLAAAHVDEQKISRYAARVAAKEFPPPNGKVGLETHRFLSAVTPQGILPQYETVEALCGRVYVIEDPLGAVSRLLLEQQRRYALGNGLDIISCPCPLAPEAAPEHLFLPQLGLCFFTANRYHPARFPDTDYLKVVRAGRFLDAAGLRGCRARLSFTRRAQRELVEEAVLALGEAKEQHDRLEGYYKNAMDFRQKEPLAKEIAEAIWKFRH